MHEETAHQIIACIMSESLAAPVLWLVMSDRMQVPMANFDIHHVSVN